MNISRFGWFMPRNLVDELWNTSRTAIDHWKSLRLPTVTSRFSLDNQAERLANLTARVVNSHGQRSSHCDVSHGDSCHGGVFYPPRGRCPHGNNTCAVLLSSYPGNLRADDRFEMLRLYRPQYVNVNTDGNVTF